MANRLKLPPEALAHVRALAALDMTRMQVRNEEAKTNPATAASIEAERIISKSQQLSARGVRAVRKAKGRD